MYNVQGLYGKILSGFIQPVLSGLIHMEKARKIHQKVAFSKKQLKND